MEKQQPNIRNWDDLIFENRNKAYGAYALRQDYSNELTKSLLAALAIMVVMLISIRSGSDNKLIETITPHLPITFDPPPNIRTEITPPVKREPVRATSINLPPVAVPTPDPVEPQPEPSQVTTGIETGTTEGNTPDTGIPSGEGSGSLPGPASTQPPFVSYAEVMPAYKGGFEKMMKTLRKHMHYPNSARTMGKEGTVYVEFVITYKGEIRDVKVMRGFDRDCDKEAVRMVEKLTEWSPGLQNKIPVNVKLVLPITFQLNPV